MERQNPAMADPECAEASTEKSRVNAAICDVGEDQKPDLFVDPEMEARSLGHSEMSSNSVSSSSDSGIESIPLTTEQDKPRNQKKKKDMEETLDEKKRRRVATFLDKLSADSYAVKTSATTMKSIPFLDGTDMVHFTADRIMDKVKQDLDHTTMWADLCGKLVKIEDSKRKGKPTLTGSVGSFQSALRQRVKTRFGDGSPGIVPHKAFLALLFCHGLLPYSDILHCIKTLLPQSASLWQENYFADDKLVAVCILVKLCVPFMSSELYKREIRNHVECAFDEVLNSDSLEYWMRTWVRDARDAWSEKKKTRILRVIPDSPAVVKPSVPRQERAPSSVVVVDEMAVLNRRLSVCRMGCSSMDAGELKKKRRHKKKKPRTVSSSSTDSAVNVEVLPDPVNEIKKYDLPESNIPVEEFSCGFHATGWSRNRHFMRGYARIIGKCYGIGY